MSVTAAASSNLPGLLIGVGLFLLGLAACVFVIAALPSILVRLLHAGHAHALLCICTNAALSPSPGMGGSCKAAGFLPKPCQAWPLRSLQHCNGHQSLLCGIFPSQETPLRLRTADI